MKTVHLRRGKSRPVQAGHPWVFAGSIEKVTDDEGGDIARVVGDRGDELGFGLFSPQSAIRVRMFGPDPVLDQAEISRRICAARDLRTRLGIDANNSVYRLLNSEGDGLPGLSADVVGSAVIFQCSTRPMFDRADAIAAALVQQFPDAAVLERPAPAAIAKLEGFAPRQHWHTPPPTDAALQVSEGTVRFHIDAASVQKTGHYADMREHRAWVAAHARDRRVLDAFSYTGGFGLHAAVAGASQVVAVDSSESAVACVAANARLNGVVIDAIARDVSNYLRSAFDRGTRFDIVVLDPPKLAPRRKHLDKALKRYESLAIEAARLLPPGGLLCIGSCSEAVGLDELGRVFGAVTARTGRATALIRSGGLPPDHPVPAAMPEGRYLTFAAAIVA